MLKIIREVLDALSKIPALLLDFASFWKGLCEILRALWHVLLRLLRCEKRPPHENCLCCIHLPPDVYKRPDPLIYPQYYLMKMGLAVTWDNPDIELFEPDGTKPDGLGALVSSALLKPKHKYRVRVRVWNGSYDAPAVGLPVYLSYLSFGVGTVSNAVGMMPINLGAKGTPQHPAFAFFDWETPETGHYCLQALLVWPDDANPDNNLGQENVNVGALHSPAEFTFTLRNDAAVRRRFILEADTYKLPDLIPCDDVRAQVPVPERARSGDIGRRAYGRLAESKARWEHALQEQAYGKFPVPPNWSVLIDPFEITLPAGAEHLIRVTIEPKGPGTVTPQAFNIHVFALYEGNVRSYEGGVTLYVTES